jgi:flagellar motor switch protein FliN/FliY
MSDTDIDTDTVGYEPEQFDQGQEPGAPGALDQDLRRLGEVPLEMSVEIGRTQMTVGETLDLRAGSIVTLDRLAGEPVDLLVNGTPIARGEVVVVDEQFGLRVTEILEGDGSSPSAVGEGGDLDADVDPSEEGEQA